MTIFTTVDHWNRRGVPSELARRYGKSYEVVLVDARPIDEIRRGLSRAKAKRVVGTIKSRDELVSWLDRNDGNDSPGSPGPLYATEGI